jgi:hypothetical protein
MPLYSIWFQVNKFYLFGLRWEDTNIDVNLIKRIDTIIKDTINFFRVLREL